MSIIKGLLVAIMLAPFLFNPYFITGAAAQEERRKQKTAQEEKVHEGYKMEPITVTAQKREENVQDIPISADVFSDIQLEGAGIQDVTELTLFSPNVFMRQSINQEIITIRGIQSFGGSLTGPAGVFVDDVSYPLIFMQNTDLLDIERIEVLRGPQGTLYGKNTESGVVNIITKQPDNELRGRVFEEYGNYNTFRGGGHASGPIVRDKLYLGLSVLGESSDGYMENEFNDDDETADMYHENGRGVLRWTPTDRWDMSFIAGVYNHNDGYGYMRFMDGPNKSDRHKIRWDGDNYWKRKNNSQALRIKYEGDRFNVVSLTGRNDYETEFRNDGDFSPVDLFPDQVWKFENDMLSQEIRVSSPKDSGPFQWLGGLYGFTEETDVKAEFVFQSKDTDIETNGYAVFGQGTYTFFDRLHLTTGLRYDHLEMEGEQKFTKGMEAQNKYDKDLDYDEILPKGSLAFDFTDDIMSYLTVSKGYLAGGYLYAFADNQDNLTYDPEYTMNYEAGIKTVWLDGKLMANAAVFYIDIQDKQVLEWIPDLPGMRRVTNAADAHSQGVELKLHARPAQGLDIFGGFGYSEAEFDDWIAPEPRGRTYDYNGKRMPYAPKYTFNAGIQYCHMAGFFVRADILGVGDFYTETKNDIKIDSHEVINLRLGFQGEHFDIVACGKNIFDKGYMVDKAFFINHLVQDGAPRTIGLTMTYRF